MIVDNWLRARLRLSSTSQPPENIRWRKIIFIFERSRSHLLTARPFFEHCSSSATSVCPLSPSLFHHRSKFYVSVVIVYRVRAQSFEKLCQLYLSHFYCFHSVHCNFFCVFMLFAFLIVAQTSAHIIKIEINCFVSLLFIIYSIFHFIRLTPSPVLRFYLNSLLSHSVDIHSTLQIPK